MPKGKVRLAVAGAAGRMGRCVLDLASRDERFEIAAALTRPDDPLKGTALRLAEFEIELGLELRLPCDVLIDFTAGDGTLDWLTRCEPEGVPMVIGATGHDERALVRIREGSAAIAIVKAANFSQGIHALSGILSTLVQRLQNGFDIEVVETHHNHKRDAPSGTALALVDELLAATGRTYEKDVIFGRFGNRSERVPGQIAVHSLRMGEIVGRHEIHFGGPGETITLTHHAQSREAFAAGALRAAAWIVGRPPGLYSMKDVLGSVR